MFVQKVIKTALGLCVFLSFWFGMGNLAVDTSYAASGNEYYVAVTGSDQNSGSADAPWRTLQKAVNSLDPGDTLYVRGGVYSEFVNVNVSGTETAGIAVRNYPGETPILDGSGLEVASGNQALVYLTGVSNLTWEGFEIRNLATSSSSYDPAGIRIKNGGSRIRILNNDIHDIRNTSTSGNAHGIHVLGNTSVPLTGLTISGNRVHHLMTGKSESLTLSGNIDGFEITNNKVFENNNIGIELAGFYGACASGCVDQTRNGVVSGNIVNGIDSSGNPAYGTGIHAAGGIYADGAANIVIERNHVFSNDFGIELASEKKGKATSRITVQNNFIHDNYGAGVIMGGADSSNGGAAGNKIVNNTFVENDALMQGYGEITLQWNTVDNLIANNIIYSNKQKLSVNKINASGSGNKLDYNLHYNASGGSGTIWRWQGVTYKSLPAFQTATGFDIHSLIGNPMFVDIVNRNIRLTSASAAVNKGSNTHAAGQNTDYENGLRIREGTVDMGALEYVAGKDPVSAPAFKYAADGNPGEWQQVPVLSKGGAYASLFKAVIEQKRLCILVQGNGLTKKSQFFLNTDNNDKTGFKTGKFTQSGAEFLLENGVLYRYTGTGGTDWSWKLVRTYKGTSDYAATDKAVEALVPLADLGVTADQTIKIGFVLNDSSVNKLPASGGMIAVPKPAANKQQQN